MKREELQRIVTELQEIKIDFETGGFNVKNLMRLESCMGDLRKYPKYFERAEGILNMIEDFQYYSLNEFVYVIKRTVDILNEDIETGENTTVFEIIKKGCKDAKDIVFGAIPEEVKSKCGEAINTASIIGAGIADTVKQEIPKYAEKVEQLKGAPKKIERKVKSKLRDWLLSEDSEEEN